MKLLSIIIPIYNLEKYLAKCLDSLILEDKKQMELLEVLMVNDGSKDNSVAVANEYVTKYPTVFRLIDKENGGSGSCRNRGLREATGKYVRFLDGDDWLSNLDKFIERLAKENADLIFTQVSMYHATTDVTELELINMPKDQCQSLENFDFKSNDYMHLLAFWHTTYKREVLQYNHNLFLEKAMYNDGILFVLPAIKGKTYILYDFVLYNYLIGREGQSLGQEKKLRNIRARYRQCEYMWEFWNQHKDEVAPKIDIEMRSIIARFANFIFGDFPWLPYKECKGYSSKCSYIIEDASIKMSSKVYMRYQKYPYAIYYILERIRNSKIYHLFR